MVAIKSPTTRGQMRHLKTQFPDIDPSIAVAAATSAAPAVRALKSAAFSIAMLLFLIIVSVGSSQLSKFNRGQQIELSAASRLGNDWTAVQKDGGLAVPRRD